MKQSTLRAILWRWHLYAGVFVYPFLLLLCVTGGIYLFKPQIDAAELHHIEKKAQVTAIHSTTPLSANQLWRAVLAHYPNAQLKRYTLPQGERIASQFEIIGAKNQSEQPKARTLWLNRYSGDLLAEKRSDTRFLHIVKKLHSELLLGDTGSYVVELAASWCIILVVMGIYLWLKRPSTHAPPKSPSRWRIRHGSWAIFLSLPLLLMLFTGLPWTQLWGGNFKALKTSAGWAGPGQEWFVTLTSSSPEESARATELFNAPLWATSSNRHHHHTSDNTATTRFDNDNLSIRLADIANKADVQQLAAPVYILPPKPNNGVWSVRGMSPNRAERETLHYDQHTGDLIMRIAFADHHPVQRTISHGISLHEGALFGTANLILVLLTVFATAAISLMGLFSWWRRKPKAKMGAPSSGDTPPPLGLLFVMASLGLFLPMAGLSMLLIAVMTLGINVVTEKRRVSD